MGGPTTRGMAHYLLAFYLFVLEVIGVDMFLFSKLGPIDRVMVHLS
jgi:hypothetical protein